MEAAVSSSLGAMGPLLRKLDLLLAPEYRLRKLVRDGIELLKEDLQEISSALVELSTLETPTQRAKCWMEEARELSYLIEDFVDDMMRTRSDADSKMRSVFRHRVGRVKIAQLPEPPRRSTRIARIAQLRALLQQASERHERYQLDAYCSSSSHMITGHGRAPTLYGDSANLFGIEDSRIKLIEMLTVEAEQRLKVISIVGPAGVGKTTLAKEIFHELGGQFELRAFVRASRKLDMRRLLGSILSQFGKLPSVSGSVQTLIDNIQEQLKDKRCFVVIDDLWEETSWDIVSAAFPERNNCSRIVATTEKMNVALKSCGYMPDNILKMKSLGIQDSANLFFNQVFGSEQQCPDELKQVSYGIIRKCGGLPLALINLSALLASRLDYSEIWYHVHDRLCSILNRSHTIEEIQTKILNLSYNSLPRCLKTCLLYFNMYPEGYIVWKVHVVKQWIAEGFINATEGKDIDEIAENYFDELVNRGMIQPMELGYSNEVLSCTVHHIILDLISHNSKEDEFLAAIDYSQTITGLSPKAHRLSFRFSTAKYAKQPAGITMPPQLRSLGFFGVHKCMPSIVEFKHLRVLILDCWGNHDGHMSLNLSRICRLFHLKYLKISSDIMVELPAQMQGLHYLETMEIDARISSVPSDIVHLPSLLYLGLQDATKLPDGIGRMKSLRTLWYFDLSHNSEHNMRSLGKLTNLQHLHLSCFATLSGGQLKRKLAPLVSSLGKFSNLKSLTLNPDALSSAIFFDVSFGIFSPPMLLQRLELLPPICFFARLPTWIGELHKLRILKIVVKELQGNDINNIALLPSLVVLSLYIRTPPTGPIIFSNMAFPALKHFKFTCGAMSLAFHAGAMPNLQRLKLRFNAHRLESHYRVLNGIEHLLNLQEVTGQIGDPPGADKLDRTVAKLSFENTIRKHPRRPTFNIQFVDFIEEDFLPLDKLHWREKEGSSGEHEIKEKDCTEGTNKHADSRFDRGSETSSTLPGRTVAIESRKQSHVVAEGRTFTNNQALEHPRLSETSVSPRKEIHLQYLDLANDRTTYCRGQKSTEIMLSTQVPCSPPSSRAHHYSTSPVPSRTFGQCQASPTAWQDDSRSSSSPQPLPLPPGSPSLPFRSLQWKKGKLLGSGTFGQVYLGFNSEGGQMCAIKEVKVISDDSNSKECLRQLNQEIVLLSQLSHPNIVQYYGSDLPNETLSVYIEYVSGGSIHKLLQEYGPFGEAVLRRYTAQILSGLAYLHGRNTVHSDIKGANILVDPNGYIKLADFGMAKHISAYTSIRSFKGSPYWMAPEVVMNSNGYSLSVDIWSLGCTILEMATAKPPWSQYEGVAAIFKIGYSKDIPDIPDHLSPEAKSFLKLCLQCDPAARPTAAQLMDHPFVKDHATLRSSRSGITRDVFSTSTEGENTTLTAELEKVDEKLKLTESLLEAKNLELKKTNDDKKAALAAQFAAEATLGRVHAAQKDDDMLPIEAILAPLETELKLSRQEIAKLQDDNRALDRLTKQKEAALLEAERTVQIAMAKAALVDDMQNKNQELMKQIEICQEENKILDRLLRQKVAEVEKLSQTVRELEEAVLQGGAAANAVREYQRKVQEMNEEKKILDRELARAKVTANRVAVVVANESKDANDKVMPVKQWLEERRFLQGEMQQLRDKLAIAERTARSEAPLKVLEDGLRGPPSSSSRPPTEGPCPAKRVRRPRGG